MDEYLDRKVVIKFLQKGQEHSRLFDELNALQRVRSRNVVEIFDVIYRDNGTRMGIVEEFIEGEDLEAKLGVLKPDAEFVGIVYQLSSGLADIHEAGVVHRDIKPSNLRIDSDGILKIFDFNLSRYKDDTRTEGFRGTRGYAPPELYRSGEVVFDEKVDIYALGITAYRLLKGKSLPKELAALPPEPGKWKAAGGTFARITGLDTELAVLLDACLEESVDARPTAGLIRDRARCLLLRGRHRALFVDEGGRRYELHSDQREITIEETNLGSVRVNYDGLVFRVAAVTGDVWKNNVRVAVGDPLDGCCVIALGSATLPAAERRFVTMDVSHPGVVL